MLAGNKKETPYKGGGTSYERDETGLRNTGSIHEGRKKPRIGEIAWPRTGKKVFLKAAQVSPDKR